MVRWDADRDHTLSEVCTPDKAAMTVDEGAVSGGRPNTLTTYVAPALAVLSCILYCINGELLQALQLHASASDGHASPLMNLSFCHLGGLLFAPYFLKFMCEPSGSTSEPYNSLSWGRVALPSLLFACMLMGYNYCWLLSARRLAASLTNALFQLSVALVCIASTVVFGEPVTGMRTVGVTLAIVGSLLASGALESGVTFLVAAPSSPPSSGHILSPSSDITSDWMIGVGLALAAAVGNTLYQVLFKYWYSSLKNDVRFLAYFGAWVSAWHVAFIPLVILASAAGFEQLQLPHGHLTIVGTAVSALIASAVNMLYICIVMWGSPMLLPCVSALSVPMMVGLDMILLGVSPGKTQCIGHVLVVSSVAFIMFEQGRRPLPGPMKILLAEKKSSA